MAADIIRPGRWRPPNPKRRKPELEGSDSRNLIRLASLIDAKFRSQASAEQAVLRVRRYVAAPRRGGARLPGYALEVDDPALGTVLCGFYRHRNTAEQQGARFAAMRGWAFEP